MPERTENNQDFKKCKPERALKKLLLNYEPEQISDMFSDIDEMFKQWCTTDWADQPQHRRDFVFALQILGNFKKVIQGIPQEKIEALRLELKQAS